MTTPMTIGRPTSKRAVLGALTLLLGALVLGACTLADWPAYRLQAMLGAVIVAAWLVDGSSKRYVGAGTAILAVGGGITLGSDVPISNFERTVVYGAIGVALILVSFVNPAAVRASGAALIFIALTVLALHRGWADLDPGWEMATVLALWGAGQLARMGRPSGQEQGVTAVEEQRGTERRTPSAQASSTTTSRGTVALRLARGHVEPLS